VSRKKSKSQHNFRAALNLPAFVRIHKQEQRAGGRETGCPDAAPNLGASLKRRLNAMIDQLERSVGINNFRCPEVE